MSCEYHPKSPSIKRKKNILTLAKNVHVDTKLFITFIALQLPVTKGKAIKVTFLLMRLPDLPSVTNSKRNKNKYTH